MNKVLQWKFFLVDMDPVVGSEQAGRRPVLVVSREIANQALPIVTVLPVTSWKPGRRLYPGEVGLHAGTGGLPVNSIVMAHQVRTISKRRLGKEYGQLAQEALCEKVREALRLHLDL